MNRRSGSTLVEVLVAIFVMGIGLVALLTLFPIGALRMAQAIHDDRSAQAGQNAAAIAIMQNIRNDPAATTVTLPGPVTYDLFKNNYPEGVGLPGTPPLADDGTESYAILVDPIGFNAVPLNSNIQHWVGNYPPAIGKTGCLRRRPVLFTASQLDIYKSFTLWDDINFENTTVNAAPPGAPYKPSAFTNVIYRDARFSWAYLLRRPQTSEPGIVDCTVVVFDTRPLLMTGNQSLPEYVYPATYYDVARNAITIDYTNDVPPPIRPGNWLLDTTFFTPSATTGTQHAYFYRVSSVEEIVIPGPPVRTLVRYEVQNPIRGFNPSYPADPTFGYLGTSMVLDGIAEVFEKGPGRLP